MTKTDFAELKEKLLSFDEDAAYKKLSEFVGEKIKPTQGLRYAGIQMAFDQHTKSAAIISELIDIIKIQSEALEKINEDFVPNTELENKLALSEMRDCAEQSLSETTTRLQKLRDGKI